MSDRVGIALACVECGARNYRKTKAKRPGTPEQRLTLKKYCSKCDKHTEHRETK